MGKEDILLKSYLSDSRRYADLWNGGVFQGRQVVKAEELEEVSPVLPMASKDIVLERIRDLVMKQSFAGQRYAVFVAENQKNIDYGIPARIMLKEALEYNRQLKAVMKENERADKEYREGKGSKVYRDAGERMYKVKRTDRLHPVATLVVYWGEEEWKGAKSLHDMMDFGDIQGELGLKDLVPEYPLHFLDLGRFEHFEYFKTELRPLLELYKKRNSKTEFMEYMRRNEGRWNMDDETWYMFSHLTNSNYLRNIIRGKEQQEKGGENMCKAIDDLVNDAKAEGKAEGVAEGKAEGILDLLEEHGEVSNDLREHILRQNDISVLRKWLKLAARANSMEEFAEKVYA